MTTDDAALAVASALEAEGVPYIIVGGYSSNTHGIPRATKDMDDFRNVILVQEREGVLDWPYIRDWCARHDTTARLDEILASLPARRNQ